MNEPRAAPPSRLLLWVTLLTVATFTILRFITAATLDLRTDEAYYWSWASQNVLSYLDQPPMVAWIERLGLALFGDTPLGARFGQLLILPLIQLILADIARRQTGSWNAALFVVLALECTLNYGFFSIVVEPNLPLLLFVSAMLWCLLRLEESGNPRWWLAVGACFGLGLLSKFLILLLAPALLAFLLIAPEQRRWLGTPWPYLAALIAIVIFSPVLVWNAQNGWVGVAFQGTRLGAGGENNLFRFVVYEVLWLGPVLLIAALAGSLVLLARGLARRESYNLLLGVAVLLPLAYLTWRSLGMQINQSWSWFLWPLAILALALVLPWNRAPRRIGLLIAAITLTGVPLVGAFIYHAAFDRSVWFGAGDPFGQDAGFDDAAQRLLGLAEANDARWIATTEYRIYAALNWQIGHDIPVIMVTQRSRFIDFAQSAPGNGRALYIRIGDVDPLLASAAMTPVDPVPVVWRGEEMRKLQVSLLDGFAPDLDPPPMSPFYAARP